jgi:hypothetical protein
MTRQEVHRSDVRELFLRQRAYEDRMRRRDAHLIGLRNDVRQALGGDPIDPYGTASAPSRQDSDELQAFKHRVRETTQLDWDRDLTTTTT